ncbi:hypothetical protein RHOSPDRAFT_27948 [Rhodotorula sp. JG-1b]|nr:hypothetical protein RHOSPDRAFT_27948 [Rhodotorula sp. JG-1b]
MTSDPRAASKLPFCNGGSSKHDGGARRGDFAMTTRQIATRAPSTQESNFGNGCLSGGWELPRSVSAIWASYKAALLQQWAKHWSAATSGASLRAIAKFPPSPSYSRSMLSSLIGNRFCFPAYAPAYATSAPTAPISTQISKCANAAKLSPANTSSSSVRFTLPLVPLSSLNSAN